MLNKVQAAIVVAALATCLDDSGMGQDLSDEQLKKVNDANDRADSFIDAHMPEFEQNNVLPEDVIVEAIEKLDQILQEQETPA